MFTAPHDSKHICVLTTRPSRWEGAAQHSGYISLITQPLMYKKQTVNGTMP